MGINGLKMVTISNRNTEGETLPYFSISSYSLSCDDFSFFLQLILSFVKTYIYIIMSDYSFFQKHRFAKAASYADASSSTFAIIVDHQGPPVTLLQYDRHILIMLRKPELLFLGERIICRDPLLFLTKSVRSKLGSRLIATSCQCKHRRLTNSSVYTI